MNEIVPSQLNTLEDVSNTLLVLQRNASECVKEVISAQLHLIQLIQIPSLIDNTMDTLILHLKSALVNSNTESEKMDVRTNFSLIVQELNMFLDLKAQYEIDQWNKAGSDLLDSTVHMMVNITSRIISATRIALDAAVGYEKIKRGADPIPIYENLASDIKDNLLRQGPTVPTGFLSNLRRWWKADDEIMKIERKRKAILIDMTVKLLKYRKIIGPSIIIAGIVDQGIGEMRKDIDRCYPEKFVDLFSNSAVIGAIIGFVGSYVVSLIVSLFRLLLESYKWDDWFWMQMLVTLIPAFVLSLAIFMIVNRKTISTLIEKRHNLKVLRKYQKTARFFSVDV